MANRHAPRPFPRQLRVAAEVHREVAEWLFTHLDTPWNTDITVTRVELTPDYRMATVRFLVHEDQDIAAATEHLGTFAHPIQRHLGARLHMKQTPKIRFLHDKQYAHAANVEKLLMNLDRPSDEAVGDEPEAGDA